MSKVRPSAIAVDGGTNSVPSLHELVERTVGPMGYELIDIEFGQQALLRIFIDSPSGVRLEDCEQVSRQLSHLFAVEGVDYDRLEVSSPGLDRPLRRQRDFERFVASRVTLRLRQPFQGRRNFEGILTVEGEGRFGLELIEAAPVRGARATRMATRAAAAQPASGAAPGNPEPSRKLVFSLDEIERARLVPIVKF